MSLRLTFALTGTDYFSTASPTGTVEVMASGEKTIGIDHVTLPILQTPDSLDWQ